MAVQCGHHSAYMSKKTAWPADSTSHSESVMFSCERAAAPAKALNFHIHPTLSIRNHSNKKSGGSPDPQTSPHLPGPSGSLPRHQKPSRNLPKPPRIVGYRSEIPRNSRVYALHMLFLWRGRGVVRTTSESKNSNHALEPDLEMPVKNLRS